MKETTQKVLDFLAWVDTLPVHVQFEISELIKVHEVRRNADRTHAQYIADLERLLAARVSA